MHRQPQHCGHRACQQARIADFREVHEGRPVAIRRRQGTCDGHGDRRLADPAGPDQRDEAALSKLRADCRNDAVAPDHPDEGRRQHDRRGNRRGLGGGRRWRKPCDRRHEAVAPARDREDVAAAILAIAQGLAQRGDMDPQVVFVHEGGRPDLRDQRILAHQIAGAFNQGDQNVQGAAAEYRRAAHPPAGAVGPGSDGSCRTRQLRSRAQCQARPFGILLATRLTAGP